MTETVSVIIDNAPIEAQFYDENTREAQLKALQATAAQGAAEDASQEALNSKDLALIAALALGPFEDTAAGLAGTTNGQYFYTVNPANLYLNDDGAPVLQDELATLGRSLGPFADGLIDDNLPIKETLSSIATNLRAPTASANLGFRQSGSGAIPRTVEDELRDRAVNVKQFGAVGNGTADDSEAIRKADLACEQTRPLYFPTGVYRVTKDGANDWCLSKFSSNRWFGDGMGRSIIYPDPGLPNTCDVVREIASTVFENRGGGANDLGILNPITGTRAGRHGWHVDTTAVNVPLQINGNEYYRIATGYPIEVVQPAYGFCHTNDVGNSEGGMYTATLADCVLGGGFCFLKTGDSIWLHNLRTVGPFPNLIDQVVNANGSGNTFTVRSGNWTNNGGILKVTNAPGLTVSGVNTENFVAGSAANNGSCAIWLKAPDVWSNAVTYTTGDLVSVGLLSYRATPSFTPGDPEAEPPVPPVLIPNLNKPPATEPNFWSRHDPFENLVFENSLLSIAGTFDGFTVVRIGTGDHVTFRNNRIGVGLAGKNAFTVAAAATNVKLTDNTFPNLSVDNWLVVETAGQSIEFDSYGTVGQTVSKGEPVTLHRSNGAITMHPANLAAGAAVGFALNNELIGPADQVYVQQQSGGTVNSYDITVDIVGLGFCRINVRNRSGGDLAEPVVISFRIMQARAA